MLLKLELPFQGVACFEQREVYQSMAGARITEVRLGVNDVATLSELSPDALSDWLSRLQARFAPGAQPL